MKRRATYDALSRLVNVLDEWKPQAEEAKSAAVTLLLRLKLQAVPERRTPTRAEASSAVRKLIRLESIASTRGLDSMQLKLLRDCAEIVLQC